MLSVPESEDFCKSSLPGLSSWNTKHGEHKKLCIQKYIPNFQYLSFNHVLNSEDIRAFLGEILGFLYSCHINRILCIENNLLCVRSRCSPGGTLIYIDTVSYHILSYTCFTSKKYAVSVIDTA